MWQALPESFSIYTKIFLCSLTNQTDMMKTTRMPY